MICWNKTLAAVAAGLLSCGGAALAATPVPGMLASAIPAERFEAPPDMDRPLLSPNGEALAVLVRDTSGRRELAVIDITNPDQPKMNIAAHANTADVADAEWVDDSRLVFWVGHENESLGDQRGIGGAFAVDRTGEHMRQLHFWVRGVLHDGSGTVVAYRSSGGACSGNQVRFHCEGGFVIPERLDTRTAIARPMVDPPLPEHPADWYIDGAGQVRAVTTTNGGDVSLYTPPATPGPWKKIAQYKSHDMANGFGVEGFGADGRFYVTLGSATTGGADTLHVMDLATGKIAPEAIISVKGFDFTGSLAQDWAHHKVLGVHYLADAAGTVWFDPGMQALQDRVDAALPGLVNHIDAASCGCAQRVLVTSWSDRQASPIAQAARITRPLMLAHGGLDRRVPIEHADRLRSALEANHAPLTWVLYRDEGHGWFNPDNRADWLRRMEAFLAANDGPLPAAAAPAAKP